MKIQKLEDILAKLSEEGTPYYWVKKEICNGTLLNAYVQSRERENERVDFSEGIWDYDVEPIVAILSESGISEFTISVRQGNLIDVLALFKEAGAEIQGITQVNNYAKEKTSALLMKIM